VVFVVDLAASDELFFTR